MGGGGYSGVGFCEVGLGGFGWGEGSGLQSLRGCSLRCTRLRQAGGLYRDIGGFEGRRSRAAGLDQFLILNY